MGPLGDATTPSPFWRACGHALEASGLREGVSRDQGKERPCLNYHMGQCDGYCRKEVPRSQHQQAIEQAVRLLEGSLAARWRRS
ncbi:MAG: hypothetical protein ACLR1T_09980 [Evtepia gabavorous]